MQQKWHQFLQVVSNIRSSLNKKMSPIFSVRFVGDVEAVLRFRLGHEISGNGRRHYGHIDSTMESHAQYGLKTTCRFASDFALFDQIIDAGQRAPNKTEMDLPVSDSGPWYSTGLSIGDRTMLLSCL